MIRLAKRLIWRIVALFVTLYLDVTLVDDRHERVPVQEGNSVQQELDLFIARKGRYGTGWVPLSEEGTTKTYVRYDQIKFVRGAVA